MDEETQRELAEGLRQGKREAWVRLYDAYAERLWRDVARLTGARADVVADVVQETFLAAARNARSFDPRRGSLWAWLWGITRKQAAMQRRQQGRFDAINIARRWWHGLNGRKEDWATGATEAPAQVLAARELATLVRATLAELPGEYQMLLAAKYMDGREAEQIAGDLASSLSAVRSKLARARHAFRRKFLRMTRSGSSVEEMR
ncbi:MAG TPA: RNA polymerase sigma factor [Phycisphaerae bacterium]|nr:RNA polymerase sigma factor [Phycisphaerae bacterium]